MKTPRVLDLEWDANDPDKRLLAVGYDHTSWNGWPPQDVLDELADPTRPKIVFTKADHRWFREHAKDVPVEGDIIDVQTMAWCYDETTPLDLDWCVKHYLGLDPDKRLFREKGLVMFRCDNGEGVPIGDAPVDELLAYNRRDLTVTLNLFMELKRRLQDTGMWDYWERVHQPLARVLLDMEMNGLPINKTRVEAMHELFKHDLLHDRNMLLDMGGLPDVFNLNSPDQMADFLFRPKFGLPARLRVAKEDMAKIREGEWPDTIPTTFEPTKIGRDYVHGFFDLKGLGLKPKVKTPKCATKKCGHARGECIPSTSAKVLKVHHGDHPWVGTFVNYKTTMKADQFLATWLEVQKGWRIYTHFNQTGTATGRLSSSDPVNLQNIPARGRLGKEIRGLFEAPAGYVFVNGDFSQIEPRLMAHFSGDPALTKIFAEGQDLYRVTTKAILGKQGGPGDRQLIKGCFLAMGYGAQPPKIRTVLAEQGWYFSLEDVEMAMSGLQTLYGGFFDWKAEVIEQARADRYVETIGGHRRHLDFHGDNRWKAELQAVNSKIQGSAADIVNETMILTADVLPHWALILQVHDEIMAEVSMLADIEGDVETFKQIAETGHGYELKVPLVFEPKIIKRWSEK